MSLLLIWVACCDSDPGNPVEGMIGIVMGDREVTSLSVVTTITTDTSTGFSQSVTGERLDRWGDALLVGAAQVPLTDDPLTNFMLDLPNDAVCELPVHLHFHGGERPVCPLK